MTLARLRELLRAAANFFRFDFAPMAPRACYAYARRRPARAARPSHRW